jgi:lysozyme family protein
MSAENYDLCLKKVLVHEGGYSNDRNDPGGATMWGITWRDYNAYRALRRLPTQDVRKMTREERDEIYKKKYWTGSRCDELPPGIDYVVFDCSVNSGCSQSIKFLQRALKVAADGHIGDHTLLALHKPGANWPAIIKDACNQRRRFLRSLKNYKTFKGGWETRVNDVERLSLALCNKYLASNPPEEDTEGEAPPFTLPTTTGAKALPTEISKSPVSTATASTTTVGATVAASAVQQAQDALGPYADALTALKYVVMGLAVIGACLTIYSIWKNHKAGADA